MKIQRAQPDVVAQRSTATARVLQHELVEVTRRLGRLEETLADAREEARELRTARDHVESVLRGEIDHLRRQSEALGAALAAAEGAATTLRAEVEQSRSWRVTRPLRAAADVLRTLDSRTPRRQP